MGLNKTASLAGISGSYLSNIEKGIKENPSLDVLSKIATALNVSINSFFEEETKDHHISLQPIVFNNGTKTTIDYSFKLEDISEGKAWLCLFKLIDYVRKTSTNKDLIYVGKDMDELEPLFNKVYELIDFELLKILYNKGELFNRKNLKGDDNNGNQEK